MAKKLKTETEEKSIVFNENVDFNSKPSNNVRDSWNQITLSLASNGGFTYEEKRKLILDVIIPEKINGKTLNSVKSFYVTKKELAELESESREFSAEIEAMLIARDSEESKVSPSKDTTKDTKKKDEVKKDEVKKVGKALTETLKKGLGAVKKKEPVITYIPSEGDIEEPDDDGIQDSTSEDEYLARVKEYTDDLTGLVDKDELDSKKV